MNTRAQLQLGPLIRHSMLELFLTAVLLFGVTTIVRFAVGPSPISRAFPQIHVELIIVGAVVALLLTGLIISRPGKISGGHMNPAISLAMWRFGVFPAAGIVPYIAGQLLGSILGVLAARAVWGGIVEQPPVLYAVIQPAPAWSAAPLFAAELIGMGVIVFAVGYFLSYPAARPPRALASWHSDWARDCTARHPNRRQLESGAPVWARSYFRAHSRTVGVFDCSDGRGRASGTAAAAVSEATSGAHASTLRNSPERTAAGRTAT